MTRREHRPAISKVQSEPTQACINDYPRILNVRFKAVNRTVLGLEFSSTYGSKQPLEPCLRWLEKNDDLSNEEPPPFVSPDRLRSFEDAEGLVRMVLYATILADRGAVIFVAAGQIHAIAAVHVLQLEPAAGLTINLAPKVRALQPTCRFSLGSVREDVEHQWGLKMPEVFEGVPMAGDLHPNFARSSDARQALILRGSFGRAHQFSNFYSAAPGPPTRQVLRRCGSSEKRTYLLLFYNKRRLNKHPDVRIRVNGMYRA